MALLCSVPGQLPLVVLSGSTGGTLPRRPGTNLMFWAAWLVMAASLLLHLASGPEPKPASFAEYMRVVESPVPEWVHWARDGLLACLKVLVFAGFILVRRLPGIGLLVVSGIAAGTHALGQPAWTWTLAAVLLLGITGTDAWARVRQVRFLGPRDAPTTWVSPAELPDGWPRLLAGKGRFTTLWLGALGFLAGALLLAGPHAGLLEAPILKENDDPLESWPLALAVLGAVVALQALLALPGQFLVTPCNGWLVIDVGDADPHEVFEAVETQLPPLPLAEARRTRGCTCADGLAPETDAEPHASIWVDEECPAHGAGHLNSLAVGDFLLLADKPWTYDEESEPLGPHAESRATGKLLFHAGSMRGASLNQGGGARHSGLLVAERLGRRAGKDSEPAVPRLADAIQWLDEEELIDIIDLRAIGLNGCVLRSRGNMPGYFPEPAPQLLNP